MPALLKEIRKLFPSGDSLTLKMPQLVRIVEELCETENTLRAEVANTLVSVKPRVEMEDLHFALKIEQMALEGVDWNQFLPVTSTTTLPTLDVDRALTLTPVKPRDFAIQTGLTPNFDCGIQMTSTPEPKISRLMNSLRISATAPVSAENDRVVALRNETSIQRNQTGGFYNRFDELDEIFLALDMNGEKEQRNETSIQRNQTGNRFDELDEMALDLNGENEKEEHGQVPHTSSPVPPSNGSGTEEFERGIMDDPSFMPSFYTSLDMSS